MMEELTTKQAVILVLKDTKRSKYWLAQQLEVQPIMINHYLRPVRPSRMSKKTADIFERLFTIKITDMYNPIKEIPSNDDTEGLPS